MGTSIRVRRTQPLQGPPVPIPVPVPVPAPSSCRPRADRPRCTVLLAPRPPLLRLLFLLAVLLPLPPLVFSLSPSCSCPSPGSGVAPPLLAPLPLPLVAPAAPAVPRALFPSLSAHGTPADWNDDAATRFWRNRDANWFPSASSLPPPRSTARLIYSRISCDCAPTAVVELLTTCSIRHNHSLTAGSALLGVLWAVKKSLQHLPAQAGRPRGMVHSWRPCAASSMPGTYSKAGMQSAASASSQMHLGFTCTRTASVVRLNPIAGLCS